MSDVLKNDDEWCEIDPIQPSHDEIRKMLVMRESKPPPESADPEVKAAYAVFLEHARPRFGHPMQKGLKLTKCGDLVLGAPQPRPIDSCPRCVECVEADRI